MIVIIAFAVLVGVIAILGIKICSRVFNPLTVFSGIWAVIFFLSSLQLFDLKSASSLTYTIMGLGVMSYIIGYFFEYKIIGKKHIRIGNRRNSPDAIYVPRYNIIYVLLAFSLVFELINMKNSLGILLNGGNLDSVLLNVRATAEDARGTIRNVLNNLIIGPFKFAIFPICAYNIAAKKKKILSVLVIMLMCIGIISSGGRVFLIYMIVSLCVVFTFNGEKINGLKEKIRANYKKNKKRYIGIIFFASVVFLALSWSRSGARLLQHMYLYFSMQPTMFDTWSEIVDFRKVYGFGEATLNGFTFHVLYLIKNIFRVPFPTNWETVFNLIIEVDTNWKSITNAGLPANAYVSAFWYFYLDARIIGVILFSFVFGMISSSVFKRTIIFPNMKNICIYCMVLFCVVDTYVRIRSSNGDYAAALLLMAFVLFKKKSRREEIKVI